MDHESFMKEALALAAKGFPAVAPNPVAGCVIVHQDKIVARGYHEVYGGPHAEVNAISQLAADVNPAECTLYVTLEPCSHFGKTPPCADLIIEKKFGRVVVATSDPNPLVSGAGVNKLKAAGIEVIEGVLKNEARDLNRRFITFHEKKRPYVVIKWAQTADGFVSRYPVPQERDQNLITREEARHYVHEMRANNMAIMVGKNTVLRDNPRLTTRHAQGRNPIRMFIDRKLEVTRHYNVFNTDAPTWIFNDYTEEDQDHISYLRIDFSKNVVEQICNRLYAKNIQSLLVEGGTMLLTEFIRTDIWDEVLVFQNPDLVFGTGIKAPEFAIKNTFELIGEDKLYRHLRNETMTTGKALEI
jgi:diaminohydroxyphosphoribosylaminopyrimidine deaminase / 5-amino-6-(5-phosphoribosylamino)uracil reductase